MDLLKKKYSSYASTVIAALGIAAMTWVLFAPGIHKTDSQILQTLRTLEESRSLLERQQEIGTARHNLHAGLPDKTRPEEAWNLWVKSVLDAAQKEGIVFQKLEPQGMKESEDAQELQLFLIFQGDIRKLVRLLYTLYENDAFSRVQALAIKREDRSDSPSFELTLVKRLP